MSARGPGVISTSQGHSKGSLCWPGQGGPVSDVPLLGFPSAVSAAAKLAAQSRPKLLCGAGLRTGEGGVGLGTGGGGVEGWLVPGPHPLM